MGYPCRPERTLELLALLGELRENDVQLVRLHTDRLARISARSQRRTVATLRGLRRALKATEASIGKIERAMENR